MAPSPPTTLQDLGTLVLSNNALALEQEVVLGTGANGPVEEGDLDAGSPELLHQEGLMRVAPGQPVGREKIDPVDLPGRHSVAQPFQSRPHQRGSAVPLVNIDRGWAQCGPIGRDPLAQRSHLAGDGVVPHLGLAGDPCVERSPTFSHAQSSPLQPAGRPLGRTWPPP
jgi:hypothetical protein